jgi:hypothetical protein
MIMDSFGRYPVETIHDHGFGPGGGGVGLGGGVGAEEAVGDTVAPLAVAPADGAGDALGGEAGLLQSAPLGQIGRLGAGLDAVWVVCANR